MFLHLMKHTRVQVARETPFTSWLHQIHVYIGQQRQSSNFTRLSITKKNTITIKDTASQMTKTKMTEVKVNYTSFGLNFAKEPTAIKPFQGRQQKFFNRKVKT